MSINVIPWDGKPISKPGVYSGIPITRYHDADICVAPSISSSGLRDIFNDSALDYWIYSPLNPHRLVRPPKEAFILGGGAHHLCLGEADFGRCYTVEPATYPDPKTGEQKPWNNNATFAREWKEHVTSENLTVLSLKQIEAIRGMAGILPWQKGLEDCGLSNSAIVRAGALSGLIEHSIFAFDDETGVWIKSRPDAIPLDSTEFNDLKTAAGVSPREIEKTLDSRRYDMQAVLASMCLEQAASTPFTSFAFIFVLKTPPHTVEVVELAQEDLDDARLDVRAALRTFAHCLETRRWPGPSGGRGDARYAARSKWSRERAMGRRSLLELELEAA